MNIRRNSAAAAFAMATLLTGAAYADGVVNVYTYRQPELIQPVLDAFTAETGIETEVLFLDKGLEERVQAEGTNSPVDVIMTVDISRLTRAKEAGITQALNDETVNSLLQAEYRDPEGHWFGLTKRARVIYASRERVAEGPIAYADLADPKYKGKICMRSGQHDYNLALISAAIAHWGEARTEEWLKGVKANLARKPDGGDRPQAGAIFAGECDIAMPAKLILAPEAEHDLNEAYGGYERRRVGLGEEFLSCVEACFLGICRMPQSHAVVHAQYRRALVRRFSFAVFYEFLGDSVVVYCVFHMSRDPEKWREFRRRYFHELDSRPEAWQPITSAARRGTVTLVYSSHDTEHNNAIALKEYVQAKSRRPAKSSRASAAHRRRSAR